MGEYASKTTVSPEKSMAEIQQILKRYGAAKFGLMDEGSQVAIAFEMRSRRVRFNIKLPDVNEFKLDGRGARRSMLQMQASREQAVRQRWRALVLAIKAKLESVESGIETFDEAFMAHMILPSGQTVAQWAAPQMEEIFVTGHMPPLLPAGEEYK